MREGTAEGSAGIQDWKREAVSHDWKAGSHKVVLNWAPREGTVVIAAVIVVDPEM